MLKTSVAGVAHLLRPIVLITTLIVVARAGADAPSFRDKVAPILERHCVVCHQGDKPKGELSLATAGGLAKGGQSWKAIAPGKPDESLLVEMISGEKPAMPQKARPLSKED